MLLYLLHDGLITSYIAHLNLSKTVQTLTNQLVIFLNIAQHIYEGNANLFEGLG